MTTLQSLQTGMQTALLQDDAAPDGLLATRGLAQFTVYRNAYRARLTGALRENYEVLPLVMGDDAFDALAVAYIAAHPSTHYSLRWFGNALPAFMHGHEDLVDHPAMVDLARMEWALRTAFDAVDAPRLTPAALADVPAAQWSQLRFELHPSVQVLKLDWAVGPVWHALKLEQEEVPAPDAWTHSMLVWRDGLRPRWKSLDTQQLRFVQSLQSGGTFGQQCLQLGETLPAEDVAPAAVGMVSEWLQMGALSRLQIAVEE